LFVSIYNVDLVRGSRINDTAFLITSLGCVFVKHSQAMVTPQTSLNLSSPTVFSLVNFNYNTALPRPLWQTKAQVHRAKFNEDKNLDGKVIVKIGGMTLSPGSFYLATCISLHPSEAPEYQISSEFRSILSISAVDTDIVDDLVLSLANLTEKPVSSEAIAFVLKYRYNQCVSQNDRDTLWKTLITSVSSVEVATGQIEGATADQRYQPFILRLPPGLKLYST
jgi:hypothetical protein